MQLSAPQTHYQILNDGTLRCAFCAAGFYANSDPGFGVNPLSYPLTVATDAAAGGVPSSITGGTKCLACPAGYFSHASELIGHCILVKSRSTHKEDLDGP